MLRTWQPFWHYVRASCGLSKEPADQERTEGEIAVRDCSRFRLPGSPDDLAGGACDRRYSEMMRRDSRGNERTDTSTVGILGPKKRCRHPRSYWAQGSWTCHDWPHAHRPKLTADLSLAKTATDGPPRH